LVKVSIKFCSAVHCKNVCLKTGVTGEMGHCPVANKWHNIQFTVIFQFPAESCGVPNISSVGKS
jgi:hypothetical protein